jgi:hypothetical protein
MARTMDGDCRSLAQALEQLERLAPGAPLLALGQTVFWDEPMKAGVALAMRRMGHTRPFVAGVHDTDYFAKLPAEVGVKERFKAFPHNDTTTRGLWSAAGEFSALFGSETVVTREMLQSAGLRLSVLQRSRPNILDEATEAWGWRGIVSFDEHTPVTADIPLRHLMPELCATLDWALDTTIESIGGETRQTAQALADEMHALVCEMGEHPSLSVAEFYRRLLPSLYDFASTTSADIETTRTSHLLRFNRQTGHLPRFEILSRFVDPATRHEANAAYDAAIAGSSLYPIARFGTGAIPFDLVIPGRGRGTLRLGTRGAVVMTDPPVFLSYKRPPASAVELAAMVEDKFGPDCAVVGKAVTLIGMLAREFVFVFHEGASSYVKYSRELHRRLGLEVHPILRVRYDCWSALQVSCSWLRLPRPFQRAFGAEELCAPSFAARWKSVVAEQEELLKTLGTLRRPIDLIRFLDRIVGGAWRSIAEEYEHLHDRLAELDHSVAALRSQRHALYGRQRELAQARGEAERRKGDQFRTAIFEKEPGAEDLAERERLSAEVDALIEARDALESERRELRRRQNELVRDEEVRRVHERRRAIELEAELKRLKLIREAVIVAKGLTAANRRPSAWWFRLVCPDGLWFRETTETAEYYLEELS